MHNIGKLCVEGLGLGFGLQGFGFRLESLYIFKERASFSVQNSVQNSGILSVQGLGFSFQGLGLRVYISLGKEPYILP